MSRELVIYADESEQKGDYYSNFYGGMLVRAEHIDTVRETLAEAKARHHFYGEIKWSKVTSQYLEKYVGVMETFFDLIQADHVKVRIMFTQNARVPTGLTAYQRERTYHLLYYQFIKHAFGLRYCSDGREPVYLRIYLDRMPDTKEKNNAFKRHLLNLQHLPEFKAARICIKRDQLAQIRSHEHDPLQCLDIVLGAMHFRLNNKHRVKPPGKRRRGKRTIAKEKLYKHIYKLICEVRPNFNIGVSTGKDGDWGNLWNHSYRHWLFQPSEFEFDRDKTK